MERKTKIKKSNDLPYANILTKLLPALTSVQIGIINNLTFADGQSIFTENYKIMLQEISLLFKYISDNPATDPVAKMTFEDKIAFINSCNDMKEFQLESPLMRQAKYLHTLEISNMLIKNTNNMADITCPTCYPEHGLTKGTIDIKQTRSSDEPATTFTSCIKCNVTYKN